MPAKKFLKNVSIPKPCPVDWDSMIGNDQVRFCEHCSLHVHNLSQMTQNQAERLINKSAGRLCVRYHFGPQQTPTTLPLGTTIHQISRRVSRLAAGAFTATLSVTSAVAQSTVVADTTNQVQAIQTQRYTGGALTGTITDPMGAVIAGATIFLSSTELQVSFYASTGSDGQFRFDGLQVGSYNLQIQAPNFQATEVDGVYVPANGESRIDRSLRIAGIENNVQVNATEQVELGGVVSIVSPKDPFIRAAQEDDMDKVTELIAGKNVNLRDEQSGTTALEHAVRNGNREMVQLLLASGANVNLKDRNGQTVLMMIDTDATSDLIWDLINAGAKVNERDDNGNTPLMQASDLGATEAVRTLLEAGAEVQITNNQKRTALMMAAAAGDVNVTRALILAGANLNDEDEDGNNALSLAIDGERTTVVRLLKSKGAFEPLTEKKKE